MSRQAQPQRHPHVAAFIKDVQKRTGCETPRDLSRLLGWAGTDRERNLYRWSRGEVAPSFDDSMMLLKTAGLLLDQPADRPPLQLVGGDGLEDRVGNLERRLEVVETTVHQILDLNESSFHAVHQTLARLEKRLDELAAQVSPRQRRDTQ